MSNKQPPHNVTILGRSIPQKTFAALAQDTTLGIFEEHWVLATVGVGSVWFVLWFVFVGGAFFSGMPGADPALVRLHAYLAATIGLVFALFGGWWHRRYRALSTNRRLRHTRTTLPRLTAEHRMHAALLLSLFGIATLVHAWNIGPWHGLLSLLIVAVELGVGYRWLPQMLNWLVQQSSGPWQAARRLDRVFVILLGTVGISSAVFQGIAAQTVLVSFLHMLSLIGLPWVPVLLGWAAIYYRAHTLYQ